jgi:hypothetical protein
VTYIPTALDNLIAENERFREALELIADASDIRDAVPQVRQIAREALGGISATAIQEGSDG